MSETKGAAVKKHKSLARGLIAGLIAGLAATAAKALAERIFPPQPNHPPELSFRPPNALRETQSSSQRRNRTKPSAGDSARRSARPMARSPSSTPRPRRRTGPASGWRWRRWATRAAQPALGLAAQPEDQTARERGSEITSYVVYGVTAELVRRLVRRWL